MSFSKLWAMVKDREAWRVSVYGIAESDMTERLHIHSFIQVTPGGGNGTPLQCSCLENLMDGGAWEATVHGVAKSRTRLSDFTEEQGTSTLFSTVAALITVPPTV